MTSGYTVGIGKQLDPAGAVEGPTYGGASELRGKLIPFNHLDNKSKICSLPPARIAAAIRASVLVAATKQEASIESVATLPLAPKTVAMGAAKVPVAPKLKVGKKATVGKTIPPPPPHSTKEINDIIDILKEINNINTSENVVGEAAEELPSSAIALQRLQQAAGRQGEGTEQKQQPLWQQQKTTCGKHHRTKQTNMEANIEMEFKQWEKIIQYNNNLENIIYMNEYFFKGETFFDKINENDNPKYQTME